MNPQEYMTVDEAQKRLNLEPPELITLTVRKVLKRYPVRRGPLSKTVERDLTILKLLDRTKKTRKEVAYMLGTSKKNIESAVLRRKRFPNLYRDYESRKAKTNPLYLYRKEDVERLARSMA